MADGLNPFLNQTPVPGVGNVLTPAPLYNQAGAYNPAIGRAAQQYARASMNAVGKYMTRRGLGDSSYMNVGLQNAYRTGFDRAVGEYQQQQQLYSNFAQQQLQMMLAQQDEQNNPSFLQGLAGGALTGAGIGYMFGGGAGAGIGALIGGGLSAVGGGDILGGLFGG